MEFEGGRKLLRRSALTVVALLTLAIFNSRLQ